VECTVLTYIRCHVKTSIAADYGDLRVKQWHSWLRHCATSWKVEGSIPDGVSGNFH
jgi:hypothetical protein